MINCVFRTSVSKSGSQETATCRLLTAFLEPETKVEKHSNEYARVTRQACEHCEYRDTRELLSDRPVLSSLVFAASSKLTDVNGTDGIDERLDNIRQWSESTLAGATLCPPFLTTHSCDVVIRCAGDPEACRRSLGSALSQDRVHTHVLLIGDVPPDVAAVAETAASVRYFPNTPAAPLWDCVRHVLADLRCQFVVGIEAGRSLKPGRLFEAISGAIQFGHDAAFVEVDYQDEFSANDTPAEANCSVIRRATLADTRDLLSTNLDEIVHGMSAVLNRSAGDREGAVELPEQVDVFSSNHFRSQPRVACDVVLPFHGQLEFVEEAIQSVLDQQHAELVIHLVDDSSPCDTREFLRRWSAFDSRIRTYRNSENIGQFSTFNNVTAFAETDYIAVHDADDLSLQHRIAWSVETLQLADCDFFAAGVEIFGDVPNEKADGLSNSMSHERPARRCSRYPVLKHVGYFAENPTLVMRRTAFVELGGFADFGDRLANRASLDTEFQARSFLAGARWAISRKTLLRYRLHETSATQNTISGWGSPAREKANQILEERSKVFLRGRFEPKMFGSLGQHFGITVPVE